MAKEKRGAMDESTGPVSSSETGEAGASSETGKATGEGESAPTYEELQSKLEEEQGKAADYLDRCQRALADHANFKRRSEQEKSDLAKFANSVLILKLLPILDDFERAVETIPKEMLKLGWVEGILLIERKLRGAMEQEGLEPIEAVGKEFDPNLHDAVLYEETGEGPTDKVVAELQKGYKLHDRVLRPTMVKVGR